MTPPACRRIVWAALALACPASALAAEPEIRSFAVTVDGRPAGTFTMTARPGPDGTETVEMAADIRVRILAVKYTYELKSTEVWKGATLVSLDASCNDDGKRKQARAANRAGVLTSTGWREPARRDAPSQVAVVDVDDGSESAARAEPHPASRVAVGGKAVEARRYKIKGSAIDAEWWFDADGCPVRQEMTSDGHKVVLTLTAVARK